MPETPADPVALTDDERQAISALERLAKRWPKTLTLLSYDGGLCVIRTSDRAYIADSNDPGRQDRILADIDGIPNDGGAW